MFYLSGKGLRGDPVSQITGLAYFARYIVQILAWVSSGVPKYFGWKYSVCQFQIHFRGVFQDRFHNSRKSKAERSKANIPYGQHKEVTPVLPFESNNELEIEKSNPR